MKSTEVQKELTQITSRLAEIKQMRSDAGSQLEKLQEGFITAQNSIDEVQSQQTKLSALDGSVTALESKRNQIEQRLNTALKQENKSSLLLQAKVAAEASHASLNNFIKIREEFGKVIAKFAQAMFDANVGRNTSNREFANIVKQIKQNSDEQFNEFKELEELGLSWEAYKTATANYINYPVTEYAEVVDLPLKILAAEIHRKEQKQRVSKAA